MAETPVAGGQLKLSEIELPSNLACKDTLNRLLSQNALWAAFQQLDNASVTNEQRVLEVKIERTYQQLTEIAEERSKGILRANPNILLTEQIQAPDIIGLRNQRLEFVQKLQQMPRAPNCKAISDCIEENTKCTDAQLAHPVNVLNIVAHECRRGLLELQQARRLIASRLSRLSDQQLADESLQRHLRNLSDRSSKEAHCFEHCMSTIENFLSQHKLSTTVTCEALPSSIPPCPVQLQHVASVIRSLVHRISSRFTVDVFISRFAWSIVGEDLNMKSDLARMRAAALTMMNSLNSTSGKGIPILFSLIEQLTPVLECLRTQFGITPTITQQDGQPFLFAAHKTATTLFALQAADFQLPAYGSTATPATRGITLPASQVMQVIAANPRPILAAAEFRTTYLKGCTWLPKSHTVLIPKEDCHQITQEHFLSSFGADIDHILQAEFVFLAESDLAVAGARIEELVHTHMMRATPASESDIGPIGQGGTITLQSLSKQSQSAIADTMNSKKGNADSDFLLPLYWLRYSQTRQMRRKLSSHLNYFASIRRRLTLDVTSGDLNQEGGAALVEQDSVSVDADGIVRIVDANGVRIMYDCVLDELKDVEMFLIHIGTMYLRKFRDRFVPDRAVMCQQLYENEVAFVEAKHQLISSLMLAYDHCVDPHHQAGIRQHVANIISRKPLMDSNAHTFIPSYASSIELMRLESALVSDIVSALMVSEFNMTPLLPANAETLCGQKYRSTVLNVQCRVSNLNHSYFDLFTSVSGVADALECVQSVCLGASLHHSNYGAVSVSERMLIYRAIMQKALVDWRILLEEQLLSQQLIYRRSLQTDGSNPIGAAASGIDNVRAGPGQSVFSASIDSGTSMADIFLILCKKFATQESLVVTLESMPALCRTIGLIMYRRLLAATAVDCGCIEQSLQVISSQVGASMSMVPLSFDEDTVFVTGESGPSCSIIGLCSWTANTRLNCSYIDTCGPSFDLSSVKGILQIIGEANHIPDFHAWLKIQSCEVSCLGMVLLNNHMMWRESQGKLKLKQDSLQETLPLGLSFDAQPNAKFLSPDHQQALAKAIEMLKKAEAAELQQVASKLLLPLQFLKPMRLKLIEEHKKEVTKILQQFKLERISKGDTGKVSEPIRQAKLSSVFAVYIPKVIEGCMLLASHSQTLTAAASIRSKISAFPQGTTPWTVKSSGSEGGGDRYNMSVSLSQGFFPAHSSLASLWHLPQSLGSFQDLPATLQDAKLYCRLMQTWLSCLSMCEFWHSLSLMTEESDARDEKAIMQLVQSEMTRSRASVEGCGSMSTVADFVTFFETLRQIMYMRVILCLSSHVRRNLADDYELGVKKTRALIRELKDEGMQLPAAHLRTLNLASCSSSFGIIAGNGPCSGILTHLGVFRAGPLPPSIPLTKLARIALDLVNISSILDDKSVDTSTPEKAIAAQIKACASAYALENFQDELVKLHLGATPSNGDDFIKASEIIDSRVNVQLLRANERMREQTSVSEALALQGKATKSSPGPLYDFSSESSVRHFLCAASCEAVCVALLEKQYKSIMQHHVRAVSEIDALATLPPSDGLSKAYESVSKVDILIDFVTDCRSNWLQRTQPDGSVVIAIPETHLGRCIDRLAQRLRTWGQQQSLDYKKDLHLQHDSLMHQLHLVQNNLKDLQLQVDVEHRSMSRRLDTAVTDRCYELLYKVQDLSGKLKSEKRSLVTLESTVRETLKKEFQAQISDLNSQLMVVKSQFAEYRESLESDMKINLHDIRKEALMKMVSSSNVPQELKNTTMQMKISEDQVAELTAENFQLKRAINKLRILQKLKDETSRSLFSKKVEASESAKKHASKELYVTMDEVEQRVGMLNRQLADLQNALLASESRCDKLRKELEHSQHNKQNLLQWKLSRAPLLEELEAKVAKYERWSHIDVDRLVSELEKRESELRTLQRDSSGPAASQSRPSTAMSQSQGDSASSDLKRLKTALQQEQKMKTMAQQKLEAIRREMLLGQQGPLSSAAVTPHEKFYQNKCDLLMEEIAKAMQENKRLWQVIRDAGIDTGDSIVSVASTRAPSRSSVVSTPFDTLKHRALDSPGPLLQKLPSSPTSPPILISRGLGATPTSKRPMTASGSAHRVVSAIRSGPGSPSTAS